MNPRRDPPLGGFVNDPDVALMLAFQKGEEHAFSDLVDRHAEGLLNWFWHQCRDRAMAEDLSQEVWGKIHRHREDYEPRARFSTWLYRVARNHWIDRFRSIGRRPSELSLDAEDSDGDGGRSLLSRLPETVDSPDAAFDREAAAKALARLLSRLPEGLRDVFLLGEVEGLPYAEVAEILEIPVGTVKSRMFNAVRRLQTMLDPTTGFDAEGPR